MRARVAVCATAKARAPVCATAKARALLYAILLKSARCKLATHETRLKLFSSINKYEFNNVYNGSAFFR